jgi:hypothetical protein
MLQQIYQSFCGSDVSHDKHTLFTLEESDLLDRPTLVSPSRKPSPYRFGSSTGSPHRRHRKKEEDLHLHTDKTKS